MFSTETRSKTVLATLETSSAASSDSNHTQNIPVQVPGNSQTSQPGMPLPISGLPEARLTIQVSDVNVSNHPHPAESSATNSSGLRVQHSADPSVVSEHGRPVGDGVSHFPINFPPSPRRCGPPGSYQQSVLLRGESKALYHKPTPAPVHEQPDGFPHENLSSEPPVRSPIHLSDRVSAVVQQTGQSPSTPRSPRDGGGVQEVEELQLAVEGAGTPQFHVPVIRPRHGLHCTQPIVLNHAIHQYGCDIDFGDVPVSLRLEST